MLESRLLQYFVTVAEELHFGKAAERLKMTQPPLSQQISQLERELGLKLFERTKRQVNLTEAGKYFLKEARLILKAINMSTQKVQQIARGKQGFLKVAAVSAALVNILPPIILSHHNSYPDIKIHIFEMHSKQQLQALLDGTIDIGFSRVIYPHEDTHYLNVYQEPLVAALPKNHRLAQNSLISIEELRNENFIAFLSDLGTRLTDLTIMLCTQAGFRPKIVHEAIQLSTMANLVAAGLGIALVPSSMTSYYTSKITYLPLEGTDVMLDTSITWHKNSDKSTMLESFIDTCIKACPPLK